MEWVETTGRTVEEAKALALEQLGVAEADAEFEVIAEAKLGLFGRLKEEARVRARVRPRYPRAKIERRDRRRRVALEERANLSRAPSQPTVDPVSRSAKREARRGGRREGTGAPAATGDLGSARDDWRGRRESRPRSATVKDGPQAATVADVGSVPAEEQGRIAVAFLTGLVERMGLPATITFHEEPEGVVAVEVTGEGLGALIGPRGATLSALQDLTRIVVQRQAGPADSRLMLDISGYRKRRQEALSRFAREVAEQVRLTGKKRALEPMPPADRKVVHDAVNTVEGVTTVSEGEEPYRRVVLVPEAGPARAHEPQENPPEPARQEPWSALASTTPESLEPNP